MGKIPVDPISCGGGLMWEKLTEENVSMSGGKKDASAVHVAYQDIAYSGEGYDLLFIDTTVTISGAVVNPGQILLGGSGPALVTKSGAATTATKRFLLIRALNGSFHTKATSSGNCVMVSDTKVVLELKAGGDGTNVDASGIIRIYGAKFNV